jgi:hypothetical protein
VEGPREPRAGVKVSLEADLRDWVKKRAATTVAAGAFPVSGRSRVLRGEPRSGLNPGGRFARNDTLTVIIAGVGRLIALAGLAKALLEYTQQGRQKRAEQFFALRRRMKDSSEFRRIAGLLDDPRGAEELAPVPFVEKRDYLGLFEEVALVVNSGLITPEVAHYMFGYYAIRCWENEAFWVGVNRDSLYWSVFADFARQMERV